MKPYGVRRQDRGCCPGHDKYPCSHYLYVTQQHRKTSFRRRDKHRKTAQRLRSKAEIRQLLDEQLQDFAS